MIIPTSRPALPLQILGVPSSYITISLGASRRRLQAGETVTVVVGIASASPSATIAKLQSAQGPVSALLTSLSMPLAAGTQLGMTTYPAAAASPSPSPSAAAPSPAPAATPSPSTSAAGAAKKSSSTGAIIGGAVGGVGGALAIGAIVFLVMRRRRAAAASAGGQGYGGVTATVTTGAQLPGG